MGQDIQHGGSFTVGPHISPEQLYTAMGPELVALKHCPGPWDRPLTFRSESWTNLNRLERLNRIPQRAVDSPTSYSCVLLFQG